MSTIEALMQAWVRCGLALALAIGAVLVLREVIGRALGAGATRRLWLAVPLSLIAALLPATIDPMITAHDAVTGTAPSMVAMVDVGSRVAISWWQPVLAIWLAGALGLAVLLAHRQQRFNTQLMVGAHGAELRLPAGESPAVVGTWRPRLALPLDFETRFTPAEQALVLAHERAHLRGHDGIWGLLAAMLWCAQWFNPLAWIAIRAFRDDLERACDAEVMRMHPRSARTYAAALLKQAQCQTAPLVSAWAARHPLVGRVAALAEHRRQQRFGRLRAALAVLLCATVATFAHAAAPRDLEIAAGADPATSRLVRLSVEVMVGDALAAKPVLVVRAGETAAIRVDGPAGFQLELTPRDVGGDRIGLSLRHANGSSNALVALGEQMLVAGGAPGVFDAPTAAGHGATTVSVGADWIAPAELDALRGSASPVP